MRVLIASTRTRLIDSQKFAEALRPLGVKTICVYDKDYYALSEFKVLKHVPFPRLLRLIKLFNPDFMFTYSTYYTAYMAKLMNRPLLVHLRGDLWEETNWNRGLSSFLPKRMLFEWATLISTEGIKKADAIFPVSKWLEERVSQHLPNHPTHVLYRGVDPEDWRPEPDMELFDLKHPAVVGVFEFEIYPKVVGLLQFMNTMRKMPEVNFYFAGNGPYTNLIKRNQPSNMFLLGRLSKSAVQKLLASGDVFVHPSGLDALPRVVTEAALMEKPIVASNVGGIPEIVKDAETGLLCGVNDSEQWVKRIRFLLDNPSVGKRFGRNARNYVKEKFDWEKIAKVFMEEVRAITC